MLDAMNKRTSIEQNERVIKWAKEAGLFVAVPVIIGYPGETIDMLKKLLMRARAALDLLSLKRFTLNLRYLLRRGEPLLLKNIIFIISINTL